MHTVLNARLVSIQPQGNKVLFVPKHRYAFRLGAQTSTYMDKPALLTPGTLFSIDERHWGARYRIATIEADGVNIEYDYSGSKARATGTVKLAWK